MVETVMKERLKNNEIRQKSPRIMELVGLAGAGKTTLAQALSQRDKRIRVAADIELRRREHIPIFVRHAPLLLPVFLRRDRLSRWFTWDEIKAMVYLKGWPSVLSQQTPRDGKVILLDHGPVFKLATLNAFGPEKFKSQYFEGWWNSMFKQWACVLDMVILLDAPEALLVERINSRNRRHAVKGKSKEEASEFLARYRASYEQILAELRARGKPMLIHFDTSQVSVAQIVDEVLVHLGLNGSGSGI
jgi:deoxyadenosine/deoxycytidine kinase